MKSVRALAASGIILLTAAAPARASDAVVYWNNVAATIVLPVRPGGPSSLLDFAKMHLAMHDAVQAYEHEFEPYCGAIPNAAGSPSAAVGAAARDVLLALLPAQAGAINTAFGTFLGAFGLASNDAGIAVGQAAAACMIALRAQDGSFPNPAPTFFGENAIGAWRSATSMVTPWLGSVTPFALNSSTQLVPAPPPPNLRSGEYTHDYNEVKDLGGLVSTLRTQEQFEMAMFYSENFLTLISRTLRTIADENVSGLGDSARMFALAYVAAADASINAWYAKVHYNFWRPNTAIQQGQFDGNPRTIGDPSWQSLIATPNYPDYTSGANNLVSSMMRTLEHFFRTDRVSFTVESKAAAAVSGGYNFRTYDRFQDMAADVIDVRIYQGIHFRFADEVAYRTGMRAADWVFSHILKPSKR
jgi:hypothetical protein